jgi:hypothetical protein
LSEQPAPQLVGSVAGQYCAKGERCRLYDPETGKAQKLGPFHKAPICDRCRATEAEADFKAVQHGLSVGWEPVSHGKDSREGRQRVQKRNLVAQMLGVQGEFRERVEKVRRYWRIDDPPAQLPPESEDFLLPPSIAEGAEDLSSLLAAAANHPHVLLSRPDRLSSVRRSLIARWESDLRYVLHADEVPDVHLEEGRTPGFVHPLGGSPIPEEQLPWYRFAAACVLYDVPLEEAPEFANYGGLPVRVLDFLSERQLWQREMRAAEKRMLDEMVWDKAWEMRSEFGELDRRRAEYEVLCRFGHEMRERLDEWRNARELEIKRDGVHNPPRRYHIVYDPYENTDKDVQRTLQVIRTEAGLGSKGRGNKDQGILLPVMIARLLEQPGWDAEALAKSLDLSKSRVDHVANEGRKILRG